MSNIVTSGSENHLLKRYVPDQLAVGVVSQPVFQLKALEAFSKAILRLDEICAILFVDLLERWWLQKVAVEVEWLRIETEEQKEQALENAKKILKQARAIREGCLFMDKIYLKNLNICLDLWRRASNLFAFILGRENMRDIVALREAVLAFSRLTFDMDWLLRRAASNGELDDTMLDCIKLRWKYLDKMFDNFVQSDPEFLRPSKRWTEIVDIIEAAQSEAQKTSTAAQPISATRSNASIREASVALWATIFITFVSIVGASISARTDNSSHGPGSTSDASFWFQLASSILQALSLAIMGYPLWSGKGWDRTTRSLTLGAIAAALIFCIASPAMYPLVATFWSGLLSLMAPAIQAFVVVQLILVVGRDQVKAHAE